MSEQENLQLVQQNYAAFGRGDLPGFLSNLTDDVVWESRYTSNIPFGGLWHGHEGVTQFFANLGETLDVKDFGIEEFISQANTVVVLGYEKVQIKSTGSEYKNEWVHVWKLKEGKVTKVRTYNDTATAAAAFQGT